MVPISYCFHSHLLAGWSQLAFTMATNLGRQPRPPAAQQHDNKNKDGGNPYPTVVVAAASFESSSPKGHHRRRHNDGVPREKNDEDDHHHHDPKKNDKDADTGNQKIMDDDNAIDLFEQEESDLLQIHVLSVTPPTSPSSLSRSGDGDGDNNQDDNEHEEERRQRPITNASPRSPLELRQYNSHDTRWGIYSSVWDGGLGLAAYLVREKAVTAHASTDTDMDDYWSRTVVIDVGSGTGIVGLSCAVASRGRAVVHITDVPTALPLLRDNVARNSIHWKYGKNCQAPLVHPLVWGEPVSDDWIAEILSQVRAGKRRRRILVVGADIVYRVSLFVPLLATLTELTSKLTQQHQQQQLRHHHHRHPKELEIECLLGCSSTRTHLNTFWKTARLRQGLSLEWKASVQLPRSLHLDEATTLASSDPHAPPEDAPIGPGLVSIVALRKLPYTFSI